MQQPERDDLAGPDRRRPGRPDRVHPGGEVTDRGEVGDDEIAACPEQRVVDLVALARRPAHMELAHRPTGWHAGSARVRPRAPPSVARRRRARWRAAAARARTGRTRRSTAGPGPRREPAIEPGRERLARHEDQVGGLVDDVERVRLADERRHDLDAGRAGQAQDVEHVVRAALRGADEADPRARLEAGDLVDELEVARADQHRDDRDPAGGQHLALVGVERGRRDEVVVEAVEPVGQVVDERALGLDQPGKASTRRSAS